MEDVTGTGGRGEHRILPELHRGMLCGNDVDVGEQASDMIHGAGTFRLWGEIIRSAESVWSAVSPL